MEFATSREVQIAQPALGRDRARTCDGKKVIPRRIAAADLGRFSATTPRNTVAGDNARFVQLVREARDDTQVRANIRPRTSFPQGRRSDFPLPEPPCVPSISFSFSTCA